MFVSRLTWVQRVVFFRSSSPVVLVDTPGISTCNLCFIIGFICDYCFMDEIKDHYADQTNIYVFHNNGIRGQGFESRKASEP